MGGNQPYRSTFSQYKAPEVSNTDGSLFYEYPIALPPGRGNLTPDLSLRYSSSDRSNSSIISTGWTVSIPYIQRQNKYGIKELYDHNTFISSLDGELVDQGNGVYVPRVENGTFLKYEYLGNTWKVTDKTGTKYYFGKTSQSRQSNPSDSSEIFTWMLEQVKDVKNNTISYTYFKDHGQIYPDTISYNQDGVFDVRFLREIRPDSISYTSGFKVTTDNRISAIEVGVHGVRTLAYDFSYTDDLLTSATVTGYKNGEEASLPATNFEYEDSATNGWGNTPINTESDYDDLKETRYLDINGDAIADKIIAYKDDDNDIDNEVYYGNGDGTFDWANVDLPEPNGEPEYYFTEHGDDDVTLTFADINGDGLADVIGDDSDISYYLNENKRKVVTTISNNNLSQEISYTPLQILSTPDAQVPFSLPVIDAITVSGPHIESATTNYQYKNASYYYGGPRDKRFAGFGEVIKTNPDGSVVSTKYHQANGQSEYELPDTYAKIGKVYVQTIRNNQGALFERTRRTYTENSIGTNASSVLLESEITQHLDSSSLDADTAIRYAYDAYGNTIYTKNYGKVNAHDDGFWYDIGSDARTTWYTYTNDTIHYIVGLPTSETVKNSSDIKESETLYEYDIIGNVIKSRRWIHGSNYADTTYSYNTYSLPISETDPLGNTTTYTYDAHNLYPTNVTNALGHTTQYEYDYSSGKKTSTTDANGFVTQFIYDALDRLIEEKQEMWYGDIETTRTVDYFTSDTPQWTLETLYRSDYDTQVIRTSYDGFGRVIQKRSETDAEWAVIDIIYDAMGRVRKTSLPYASPYPNFHGFSAPQNLYTTNTYDALGRIIETENVRGSTNTVYDGFTTIVTDALNNVKEYVADAFGNLSKVKEHNGSNTYTTTYQYNTQNNLTKITDAEGNVRNISYDALGRRTYLQDLHKPNDYSYGSYNFTYNDSNLTEKNNPDGTITNYTYDALNRLLTENSDSTSATDIVNQYDTCGNGIGYICTITTPDVTTNYDYNQLGLVLIEDVTIDNTTYTKINSYNRQNQLFFEWYPNSANVYTYFSKIGKPNKIVHSKNGNVINDISLTYGIHGLPTTISYPNGVVTTNTYDANNLYALTQKKTVLEAMSTNSAARQTQPEAIQEIAPSTISNLSQRDIDTADTIKKHRLRPEEQPYLYGAGGPGLEHAAIETIFQKQIKPTSTVLGIASSTVNGTKNIINQHYKKETKTSDNYYTGRKQHA